MTMMESASLLDQEGGERALGLLRREASDLRVARQLGVTVDAVRRLRLQAGIPARPPFTPHPQRDAARELLQQGTPPREVAARLGLPWCLVRQWAVGLGRTPPNQRDTARARRLAAEEMLKKGHRPKEVAASCGVHPSSLARWARVLGMPALTGRRPRHPGRVQAEAMLAAGRPVKDIAAAVGTTDDMVYQWKRQLRWQQARETPVPESRPRHPQRDAAERLLRRGDSTRDVARALSVSRSTVWAWRSQL